MRMSFSILGRLISVRLSMPICCSTLGCTAKPLIRGFRIESVSTKMRAVASYWSGIFQTATTPTTAVTQATTKPGQRNCHIPRRLTSSCWTISCMRQ